MEESRRRGGGGGAAVSKNAARHADAFGPPQRKFASGRLDDYAEIFGDLAGSCSIPFLDLQPALEGLALPAAGFDYSEVFRALDFGDFAAPCEELFPAPRREAAVAARSVNGRTMAETTSSQQATVKLNFSTRHSNGGHMANREADWSSSNSNCSDNGSMRLNVSHTKSTKQSTEASMNGKTNAARYNDTPASSFVINTPSSIQNIGGDGPHDMLSDGIDIRKQQKIISVTSTDNSKCPENSMHADQNDFANSEPVPKDDHANVSHHSRSSSSSISSGDASSSNVTYVTVSDISLRTQPLGVPPPSRPPPRSSDKQGCPKPRILSGPILYLDEVALSKPVAKDRVHQDVVKDNSPSFFDVEIDVSSAAAIKEAMELAQAKLKSAKELMEKKRNSLQNSRKLGNHESVKRKERMMGQISIGQESFEENLAASQKINEATSAAKLTQHCEEMETVEVLTKEDEQSRQRNDLKSYKVSKSADKSEKWETNKEYHELVNSDKYEMTDEVFEREGSMKKAKLMTTICEAKQNDSIKDALVYEIESNRNLRKENLVVAPSVHEENADLEADGLHVEEVEKLEEIHKLHRQEVRETEVLSFAGSDRKIKPSDNSKITSDDKRGKSKLDAAVASCEGENSSNFVEINGSKEGKEEKGKSEATKCHGETIQKEISIANKISNSSDGEGKLNMTNSTVAEEEIELQVPQRSCISKVEGNEGACKCTDSENTRIEEKQCNAQNVEQLEGTIAMHEQEKKEEQHMKQQSCLSSENELRHEVDQETTKLEEDISEWKSSVGATAFNEQVELMKAAKVVCWQDCNGDNAKEAQLELQHRHEVDQETTKLEEDISEWKSSVGATACNEQVELMKAAKVVCWQDCNGDNAKEAQLERQHRDTKEDEFPESYSRENFEGQKMYKKELWGSGNEGIVEIQVGCDFMDKILSVDPVISRGPLNMALDFQPTNLSREGGNLSIVSMKRHPVTSQKIISDIKKAEEQEKGRVLREKQEIIKQERRLEEEKKEEKFQEENKVKTSLLEERKEIQRKLEEDIERARLFDEVKERERKLEEEKERERLLEEANERERKLKVEKEQARLLEEAIERERKLKEEKERSRLAEEAKEKEKKLEEKEQARLLEETKEKERKLKEEKEQARLLEEAKERERQLKEEKEQARLLEEAKERERKLKEEKEQARLLEEAKEREKKLEEEQARLLEKTKGREKKIVDEQSKFSEERIRKGRKLEEEKDRARLSEEGKDNERKLEEERAKLLEKVREREKKQEEKEREREREKDRAAVERATREAHERAFAEARERAERIAVERVTSEVWQRALKEAQEKAEKTSLGGHEKSSTDKASREARLRAERAAVERATAEARERAAERALAGKAAADAREHAERNNGTSRNRMRKVTVTEVHLKAKDKDGPHDGQLCSNGALSSYQTNYDSNDRCEGESVLRCKARLERHQRIAERAAKALAEKNIRDILAQREQAERDRLSEFLDADVKRWSNGKEGNLRALLSTLQYILGPESGWQPIPLTDVITAAAVKKAYRKATLCVHPDKLQQRGASIQQKYICEKVFDLLKEAWNRFNSEER